MVWLSAAATSSSLICLLFFVFINGAFRVRSLPPPTCSTWPPPPSTPTTRPQSSPTCLTRPLPPSTQTCPARPSPPPPTMPAEHDDRFVLYKKNKKELIYIYQMFICISRYGALIYVSLCIAGIIWLRWLVKEALERPGLPPSSIPMNWSSLWRS